mmetsp:Transcript_1916/g.4162  ORF Transcript_1916/g.4162 Transcript_1916/m.4162 type:complete len:264 (-) Transcript_1916:610-1401(-)
MVGLATVGIYRPKVTRVRVADRLGSLCIPTATAWPLRLKTSSRRASQPRRVAWPSRPFPTRNGGTTSCAAVFCVAILGGAVCVCAVERGLLHEVLLDCLQLLRCHVVNELILASGLLACLHLGLLDCLFQVLLARGLAIKHVVDRSLFVERHLAQAGAHLQDVDTAVSGAHGDDAATLVCRKRREAAVGDLHRECGLVVLVVQVPHIHRAVHLDGVEHARPCRRPRAAGEVRVVVLCRQDGRLDGSVVRPHTGRPVAYTEEVL